MLDCDMTPEVDCNQEFSFHEHSNDSESESIGLVSCLVPLWLKNDKRSLDDDGYCWW